MPLDTLDPPITVRLNLLLSQQKHSLFYTISYSIRNSAYLLANSSPNLSIAPIKDVFKVSDKFY